jgi:hypothetical protein
VLRKDHEIRLQTAEMKFMRSVAGPRYDMITHLKVKNSNTDALYMDFVRFSEQTWIISLHGTKDRSL